MTYHSSVRDKGWFQTEHNAQAVETDASLVLRKFSARYVCVYRDKSLLTYLVRPLEKAPVVESAHANTLSFMHKNCTYILLQRQQLLPLFLTKIVFWCLDL